MGRRVEARSKKANPPNFEVGDYVSSFRMGNVNKLQGSWKEGGVEQARSIRPSVATQPHVTYREHSQHSEISLAQPWRLLLPVLAPPEVFSPEKCRCFRSWPEAAHGLGSCSVDD
eukprot:Rmarinus@m.6273